MRTPEALAPAADELRAAIEEINAQLSQATEGRFDFEVTPSLQDDAVQRMGQLINVVLESTRTALAEMEKYAWDLVALDSTKSKFLTTVSHELRTPLTLILGPLELLLAAGPEQVSPAIRESLGRMRRNGARLLSLLNQLLDFTELEVGRIRPQPQPLDVADLVAQIVEDCQPVAESQRLALDYRAEAGLGLARLDPGLFEKIVLTLLSNALKFTPAGGRVSVTLRRLGEELELSVADTGIGIPEDKVPLLFQQFQQADSSATRSYEGLGLGLALIKEFAELMGGSVGVQSVVGEGSCFSVRLPRVAAVVPPDPGPGEAPRGPARRMQRPLYLAPFVRPAAPRPSQPPVARGERPRVLIAEENQDMLAFLSDVLSPEYDLITARSGREALLAARDRSPDVILSEVMLPEVSGVELLAQVKQDPALRPIPFILLTARAEKSAAVDGLAQGADDYIAKPFAPMELRARVQAAWRMRRLHKKLIDLSREAAMAEVAAGVLHNVGNGLNSINVSATVAADLVKRSRVAGLRRAADLLAQHDGDLGAFLTSDEKGRHLPAFLIKLAAHLCDERDALGRELDALIQGIDRVKTVVAMQEAYVRAGSLTREQELALTRVLEDAGVLTSEAPPGGAVGGPR